MIDIKPGDRVKIDGSVHAYTVEAFDYELACLRAKNGNIFLARRERITLIPPKIAEPGIGEVVWDFCKLAGKRIPWVHLVLGGWAAPHYGYRDWSDFSDDVTLAVDPKAGA